MGCDRDFADGGQAVFIQLSSVEGKESDSFSQEAFPLDRDEAVVRTAFLEMRAVFLPAQYAVLAHFRDVRFIPRHPVPSSSHLTPRAERRGCLRVRSGDLLGGDISDSVNELFVYAPTAVALNEAPIIYTIGLIERNP
jgi:hypothetical protein